MRAAPVAFRLGQCTALARPESSSNEEHEQDARKVDEIVRRINVGPQDPGASERRLNQAVGLIWAPSVGIFLAIVAFRCQSGDALTRGREATWNFGALLRFVSF